MIQYLLDTNHLSPLLTPGHPVRQMILERAAARESFAIPTPVLSEFLFGIGLLPRRRESQAAWNSLAEGFRYYPVDRQDAEAAAALRLHLRQEGRQLALVDSLVAAIALRYQLILLTTDADFNSIPGLERESWW